MNKDKVIKDLKERNNSLNNQFRLRDIRVNCLEHQSIEKDKEIERLNKELETLKQPQVFIDTQDMEERYGEELYKEYLEKENKRLHSIIKEVREYIDKEHKLLYLDKPGYTYTKMGSDILEILDKENRE